MQDTTLKRRESGHKYLEAAVMVDEVVQANYGNLTEIYILMVGNIVSKIGTLYSWEGRYLGAKRVGISNNTLIIPKGKTFGP